MEDWQKDYSQRERENPKMLIREPMQIITADEYIGADVFSEDTISDTKVISPKIPEINMMVEKLMPVQVKEE